MDSSTDVDAATVDDASAGSSIVIGAATAGDSSTGGALGAAVDDVATPSVDDAAPVDADDGCCIGI